MKLNLREDPREWRKAVWFASLGFGLLASLLWWRGVLQATLYAATLGALFLGALAAHWRPRWFRGYYRFMGRLAFRITQTVGFVLLAFFFLAVLTPVGIALRLAGKDLLRLKKQPKGSTYWQPSREQSPLDRAF